MSWNDFFQFLIAISNVLLAIKAFSNDRDILPSIAKHNEVVLCRLRSSRQSHYVALAEGV